MSSTFTSFELSDLRFPTSRDRAGSDAMNPDPNYSAAYLLLRTSAGDEGHGFVFTIGRGNDVAVAAMRAIEPLVVGLSVEGVLADLETLGRYLPLLELRDRDTSHAAFGRSPLRRRGRLR